MSAPRILFAGGGTGGHLYPALAIADRIQKLNPQSEIRFVGTRRGLEGRIEMPFAIDYIFVRGLNRVGTLDKLLSLAVLPWAFLRSLVILLKFRPHFVLGVGGFVSGPVLMVAALMGKKTAVWEANAVPGFTNRLLAKVVQECWFAFAESQSYVDGDKVHKVGVPVRSEFSWSALAVHSPLRLLVFGGSQGARGINQRVTQWILANSSIVQNCEIRFQTGLLDFEETQTRLKEHKNVTVYKYLDTIHEDCAWCDLALCRSGAGSINDLSISGRGAILIPLPYGADDHQRENARVLHKKEAAIYIEQADLDSTRLDQEIGNLISSPEKLMTMAQNISQIADREAADRMAQMVLARVTR